MDAAFEDTRRRLERLERLEWQGDFESAQMAMLHPENYGKMMSQFIGGFPLPCLIVAGQGSSSY